MLITAATVPTYLQLCWYFLSPTRTTHHRRHTLWHPFIHAHVAYVHAPVKLCKSCHARTQKTTTITQLPPAPITQLYFCCLIRRSRLRNKLSSQRPKRSTSNHACAPLSICRCFRPGRIRQPALACCCRRCWPPNPKSSRPQWQWTTRPASLPSC